MKLTFERLVTAVTVAAVAMQGASGLRAEQRQFWPEILAFLKQDRAIGLAPCRTLFVGSSSIRLWGSLASDFPKRHVIRRGFGGAHLTHVVQHFDILIKRHRPREIVLYAGENDIASGRPPVDVLTSLRSLLNLKSRFLGATPVYFIAIKPSHYHWGKFAKQTRTNALIKQFAATRDDLVFVDVVRLMLENGKPRRLYISDGLHMNRDGYEIWAEAVNEALDHSGVAGASYCRR